MATTHSYKQLWHLSFVAKFSVFIPGMVLVTSRWSYWWSYWGEVLGRSALTKTLNCPQVMIFILFSLQYYHFYCYFSFSCYNLWFILFLYLYSILVYSFQEHSFLRVYGFSGVLLGTHTHTYKVEKFSSITLWLSYKLPRNLELLIIQGMVGG